MKQTLNLGKLTGPLLVFGGPYSNLEATQAMQAEAMRLGIPSSNIICTGDVVAYCAEPEATTALIRAWGIHVVQGNCEYAIGHDENNCGCGFEIGSACAIASNEWFLYTRKNVSEQSRAWMKSLPTNIHFQYYGQTVSCIHGGLSQQNQFIFESTNTSTKTEQLQGANADIMIGGHCGLPFGHVLETDSTTPDWKPPHWLNAGVIGIPANDGTPRTWYMLLEPASEGQADSSLTVTWHALFYDHDASIEKMSNINLSSTYQASMRSGFWPNMDILPDAERKASGQALAPNPLYITT
jgi:predicted phosphodiesterase